MVAADWSATKSTKIIDYIGDAHGGTSPSYGATIEFHRFWQALADDGTHVGDDEIAIIVDNPTDRQGVDNIVAMQNGWTITAAAAEHLYDGSIIMNGGDDIWDGVVNYGATSKINIMQNGALIATDFWNSFDPAGFNPDATLGISHRFMVKVRTAGADIDGRRLLGLSRQFNSTYAEFPATTGRGNNTLALSESTDLNNTTAAATVATWTGIVNDTEGYVGIDANGDAADEFYYSDWELATRTKNEFFERMKWLVRDGTAETMYGLDGNIFRGITHEVTVDTPTGTFAGPEALSWGTGATAGTGQLMAINSPTAATTLWMQLLTGVVPADGLTITGGTSTATVDVNVTVTEITVSRTNPFIGASTGSAIIGAFGIGIGADDLAKDDRVIDLTGTQRIPPNSVTWTATGLVSGEDRLLVAPLGYSFEYDNEATGPFTLGETLTFTSPAGTATLIELLDNGATGRMVITEPLSGDVPTDNSTIAGATATADVNGSVSGNIDKSQMGLNALLSTDNITSIVMDAPIPSDTPTASNSKTKLRVVDNNGVDRELEFSSWTGSTFTISTTDGNEDFAAVNASAGNNAYLCYLDLLATASSESFVSVYDADRNLYVRARDGAGTPTKEFSTTSALTGTGGGSTINRTSDE
jgi:hypothetical protein